MLIVIYLDFSLNDYMHRSFFMAHVFPEKTPTISCLMDITWTCSIPDIKNPWKKVLRVSFFRM